MAANRESAVASMIHRARLSSEDTFQAFHDAGSYDAQAGTGGIDGSIAFETTRAENFGPFLAATINQYKTFQVGMIDEEFLSYELNSAYLASKKASRWQT